MEKISDCDPVREVQEAILFGSWKMRGDIMTKDFNRLVSWKDQQSLSLALWKSKAALPINISEPINNISDHILLKLLNTNCKSIET